MTDEELIREGKAARYLCSPMANFGKPPRKVFVIQLEEAKAEWPKRHQANCLRMTLPPTARLGMWGVIFSTGSLKASFGIQGVRVLQGDAQDPKARASGATTNARPTGTHRRVLQASRP